MEMSRQSSGDDNLVREEIHRKLRSEAKDINLTDTNDGHARNICILEQFEDVYYSESIANPIIQGKLVQDAALIILETGVFEFTWDLVAKELLTWDAIKEPNVTKKTDENEEPVVQHDQDLHLALRVLVIYTNKSTDFTNKLAGVGPFMSCVQTFIRGAVEHNLEDVGGDTEHDRRNLDDPLQMVLNILTNICMIHANVETVRSLDLIGSFQNILPSPKRDMAMTCLVILAAIVTEDECDIIASNENTVSEFLDILRKGLKTPVRQYEGWSCRELGRGVRKLARNDANKALLVELGVLELLVELGETGNIEEQYESVQAIWTLCFDAENVQIINSRPELGIIDLLTKLQTSSNPGIQQACKGALWTMNAFGGATTALTTISLGPIGGIAGALGIVNAAQGVGMSGTNSNLSAVTGLLQKGLNAAIGLLPANETRPRAINRPTKDTVNDVRGGHIMLSYEWGDQPLMKKVRDVLRKNKFKVWMDIDDMAGSTFDAMADAVEKADLVLICMSQKYKESPPCGLEGKYAQDKRKLIIPLKSQRGYKPDGWLGLICAGKLYHEFSTKFPFDEAMAGLLREIKGQLGLKE